jgi:hypothetical protein
MATFNVCSNVDINVGGSFYWHNPATAQVKVTPVTTWPLPLNEYDIPAGGTTGLITSSGSTLPNTSYNVNVRWYSSVTPGSPCPASGANPKIVVGAGVAKSEDPGAPLRKAG